MLPAFLMGDVQSQEENISMEKMFIPALRLFFLCGKSLGQSASGQYQSIKFPLQPKQWHSRRECKALRSAGTWMHHASIPPRNHSRRWEQNGGIHYLEWLWRGERRVACVAHSGAYKIKSFAPPLPMPLRSSRLKWEKCSMKNALFLAQGSMSTAVSVIPEEQPVIGMSMERKKGTFACANCKEEKIPFNLAIVSLSKVEWNRILNYHPYWELQSGISSWAKSSKSFCSKYLCRQTVQGG